MLEEQIDERKAVRLSPLSLGVIPPHPPKKTAKEPATTQRVVSKSGSVRPMGLTRAARSPRIGKATKAIGVKEAQGLTPENEGILENRVVDVIEIWQTLEKQNTAGSRVHGDIFA